MHLSSASPSNQIDNGAAGVAAHNRVVDHHHTLAVENLIQSVEP